MKKIQKLSNNFYQVSNIFSQKACNKILKLFIKEKRWKFINQVRKNHYNHVFKSNEKLAPSRNEYYYAKFYRNENLQNNSYIQEQLKKEVVPILKRLKIKYKKFDIRCHKFLNGNFLRMHYDHYAGTYAVTINLNKEWKWDWGGLLCVVNEKKFDVVKALCPQWNSMNLLCSFNKNKSSPHFVTSVEKYALSPRYSITVFIS
jgi:hypothetical protein